MISARRFDLFDNYGILTMQVGSCDECYKKTCERKSGTETATWRRSSTCFRKWRCKMTKWRCKMTICLDTLNRMPNVERTSPVTYKQETFRKILSLHTDFSMCAPVRISPRVSSIYHTWNLSAQWTNSVTLAWNPFTVCTYQNYPCWMCTCMGNKL